MIYKIFISAGDLSGEIHAANLIKEIKNISPSSYISSVGGNNLKNISDNFIEDIVNINAFGFFPIKQIFFLIKVFKKIKNNFNENRPDKIVLVDYYGFNIHIAKLAKKFGIPVYYYISPQIWASRKKRIKKIYKFIKKMIVILPFEEKIYKDNNINVVFIGNPLVDIVLKKNNYRKTNFSFIDPPIIGLFPGVRSSIMRRHIPIIIKTAAILKEKINAKFIMFNFDKKNENYELPDYIDVCTSQNFENRRLIDFAICSSGTVCLENALIGIPMIVIYKLSYFNYIIARLIIKVKYISIVNILLNKLVLHEFIQFNAKPKNIAKTIISELKIENYISKVEELCKIKKMFKNNNINKKIAKMIVCD
jgi:lipid-A-disaccharide synthase